jgi:hypothetical protein
MVQQSLVSDQWSRLLSPIRTSGPSGRPLASVNLSDSPEDSAEDSSDEEKEGHLPSKSANSSKSVARSPSNSSSEEEDESAVEFVEDNSLQDTPIKQEPRRSTRPPKQSQKVQDSIPTTRSQTRSLPHIRVEGKLASRPSTPPPTEKKKGKKPQLATPQSSRQEKKTKKVAPPSKVILRSDLEDITPAIDPQHLVEMVDSLELSPVCLSFDPSHLSAVLNFFFIF